MNLLDPAHRSSAGTLEQADIQGALPVKPTTLFEASMRDFVFAEVWSRTGLDRRSRFFIAISGASTEAGKSEILDSYIRGAFELCEITLAELREAALHLAVYATWQRGAILDAAITRVARELGFKEAPCEPIRAQPWDPQQRLKEGAENFSAVMVMPAPPPVTPYFEAGILNFVFGEMWMRDGLDQRARRWITLVGVADSSASTPIRTHIYAAMASGNATAGEMQEFVLQYAIHGGWPKASVVQAAVLEMSKRVAAGLPYE
jgi:4-carboxymuconolactone decarboxylase